MTFNLTLLLLLAAGYQCAMFSIAWLANRDVIPRRLTQHPVMQMLSLGIFASAWAFYGVTDLAYEYGYGALSYYMGTGALFIFAPLILMPFHRLARQHQLGSLADLLAFRYRSRLAGTVATLSLLLCLLPLLALQIAAVTDTAMVLSWDVQTAAGNRVDTQHMIAGLFCASTLFCCLLWAGVRQQRGLLFALALESLLKVGVLLAVGWFAIDTVFGGMEKLDRWLAVHPENLQILYRPIRENASHMLLLLFFSSAIAMPHIFQFAQDENTEATSRRTLGMASWAMPLYLLIIGLPVFPLLWAGFKLGTNVPPEYFTLGVPLEAGNVSLTLMVFLGGFAAASSAIIMLTLALATMILKHLILPFSPTPMVRDLHGWLAWVRRGVIVGIVLLAWMYYTFLGNKQGLSNLALIAFIGLMQFLPGILSVIYWPVANRKGFCTGLLASMAVWFVGLILPLITAQRFIDIPFTHITLSIGMAHWDSIAIVALALNCIVFALVSRFTPATAEEQQAAELCSMDKVVRPLRSELDVHSVIEVEQRLAQSLGTTVAQEHIQRVLRDLDLPAGETRPFALRRLRDQLEANLSGLLGPSAAQQLVDTHMPYHSTTSLGTEDITFVESQLGEYRSQMTGLAAELDNLRRYHRQTLEDLPLALCSIDADGEIQMWNRAMALLTAIPENRVQGSLVNALPEPWNELMTRFLDAPTNHLYQQKILLDTLPHWISLHKTSFHPFASEQPSQIVILEDTTETRRLEEELIHSERLASVGRFAAGVAHEIGNPVTGIACLAQNLKYDRDEPPLVEKAAEQILGQTDRISRIVQSLMGFSHSGKPEGSEHAAVDLYYCTEEAIQLLALQQDAQPVVFNNQLHPAIIVKGDVQQLVQVMINLLSNARDASSANGVVTIAAHMNTHTVTLSVRDNGSGIPGKLHARLFEPFFTTKDPGKGTGLGLAMVHSIIEAHEGTIQIKSPINDDPAHPGTEFMVVLPCFNHDHTGANAKLAS